MHAEYVLHLINGSSILGAERVAIGIAQQGIQKGASISIGLVNGDESLRSDISNQLKSTAIEVVCLSGNGVFTVFLRLLSYCRKKNISLIHSHGYKSNLLAFGVKILNFKLVLIATNHNYITSSLRERLYRLIDLQVLKFFSGVVAVSSEVKNNMVSGGLTESSIVVIDNGIEIPELITESERVALRSQLGFSEDNILLGIVASLTKEKAHEILFKAFLVIYNKYPNCRLLIVGDGPLLHELEELRVKLNLIDGLHFLGYRSDILKVTRCLDLFILPSYKEGLPMALLEAMAAVIPVVASRVGAIPDVVDSGVNGLLVNSGNIEQLAYAMDRLIGDETLRINFAWAGRRTVVDNYSSGKMADKYFDIYKRALQ